METSLLNFIVQHHQPESIKLCFRHDCKAFSVPTADEVGKKGELPFGICIQLSANKRKVFKSNIMPDGIPNWKDFLVMMYPEYQIVVCSLSESAN